MTFTQWLVSVGRYRKQQPEQRAGQAFYNCLPKEFYGKYHGTALDCFYNDEPLADMLIQLQKDWGSRDISLGEDNPMYGGQRSDHDV